MVHTHTQKTLATNCLQIDFLSSKSNLSWWTWQTAKVKSVHKSMQLSRGHEHCGKHRDPGHQGNMGCLGTGVHASAHPRGLGEHCRGLPSSVGLPQLPWVHWWEACSHQSTRQLQVSLLQLQGDILHHAPCSGGLTVLLLSGGCGQLWED